MWRAAQGSVRGSLISSAQITHTKSVDTRSWWTGSGTRALSSINAHCRSSRDGTNSTLDLPLKSPSFVEVSIFSFANLSTLRENDAASKSNRRDRVSSSMASAAYAFKNFEEYFMNFLPSCIFGGEERRQMDVELSTKKLLSIWATRFFIFFSCQSKTFSFFIQKSSRYIFVLSTNSLYLVSTICWKGMCSAEMRDLFNLIAKPHIFTNWPIFSRR